MIKKIFSNWGLKLVSLILAFGLWLLVVYIEDPIDEVRLTVPVDLLNTDVLTDNAKVYEVLEGASTVVIVKAPKSVVGQLKAEDIKATADVNELTLMNTIEIKITMPNRYNYSEYRPDKKMVRLSVEDRREKSIEIKVNIIGEVPEGYELESAESSRNRMNIWGAESKVNQVAYALVDIDVREFTSDTLTAVTIRLCDAEGRQVTDNSVSRITNTVDVKTTVYATKDVPIIYQVTGVSADGYLATGEESVSVRTVRIAGPEAILKQFSGIVLPEDELNINGFTDDYERDVDIREYLPNGVRLANNGFNGRVVFIVYIEPLIVRRLSIPRHNIQLINVPDGFEAAIADEETFYELEVRGLEARLAVLQGDQMHGIVDVGGYFAESGREPMSMTYGIPAKFTVAEDVAIGRGIDVRIMLTQPNEEM